MSALALLIGLATPAAAEPDDGEWDPTLPKLISSGAPGDPSRSPTRRLQATAQATQTTMNLGQKFLSSIGLAPPEAASVAPGGRVRGPQAIEYVIRRGGSQMGVPYSWGGGTLTGPSAGVDSGAKSRLRLLGADPVRLRRRRRADPEVLRRPVRHRPQDRRPSQAKRGDLIFWGPGGSQHVAIYLGGGKMLEASGSAGKVTVSPVRTARPAAAPGRGSSSPEWA